VRSTAVGCEVCSLTDGSFPAEEVGISEAEVEVEVDVWGEGGARAGIGYTFEEVCEDVTVVVVVETEVVSEAKSEAEATRREASDMWGNVRAA